MFCVPNEPWELLYVSPASPGNHHISKFCTSNHSGRTGSPVSHRSHYMRHAMIYPFPDILFRQWALGATSYQCHVHVEVRCIMCPHWAPGAPMLQNPLHLAILDVLGPLWAIWATIWTTSRSIHFQTFMSPLSPGSHLISMSYTYSRSMHYVSPLSPGSHQALTPFTFSYFGRSGSLRAIGATIWIKSRSIHYQTFFVPNEPWEPLYINIMYF